MMGSDENSTPILLLHGWPSTVWEFHKSIPLLLKQGMLPGRVRMKNKEFIGLECFVIRMFRNGFYNISCCLSTLTASHITLSISQVTL